MQRDAFLGPAPYLWRTLFFGAVLGLALSLAGSSPVGAQEAALALDCEGSAGEVETQCQFDEQQEFTVAIHALSVPEAGYSAAQAKLRWDGAVVDYRPTDDPSEEVVWPECDFPARRDNRELDPSDTSVLFGCISFPPVPSSYTGPLFLFTFVCVAPGTSPLTLVAREGDPQNGSYFVEFAVEFDPENPALVDPSLTGASVTCGPPQQAPLGDVNCDGIVNSIDAALILQFDAGLTASLACQDVGDVNQDGTMNSIDAALVLQLDAGLIASLAP